MSISIRSDLEALQRRLDAFATAIPANIETLQDLDQFYQLANSTNSAQAHLDALKNAIAKADRSYLSQLQALSHTAQTTLDAIRVKMHPSVLQLQTAGALDKAKATLDRAKAIAHSLEKDRKNPSLRRGFKMNYFIALKEVQELQSLPRLPSSTSASVKKIISSLKELQKKNADIFSGGSNSEESYCALLAFFQALNQQDPLAIKEITDRLPSSFLDLFFEEIKTLSPHKKDTPGWAKRHITDDLNITDRAFRNALKKFLGNEHDYAIFKQSVSNDANNALIELRKQVYDLVLAQKEGVAVSDQDKQRIVDLINTMPPAVQSAIYQQMYHLSSSIGISASDMTHLHLAIDQTLEEFSVFILSEQIQPYFNLFKALEQQDAHQVKECIDQLPKFVRGLLLKAVYDLSPNRKNVEKWAERHVADHLGITGDAFCSALAKTEEQRFDFDNAFIQLRKQIYFFTQQSSEPVEEEASTLGKIRIAARINQLHPIIRDSIYQKIQRLVPIDAGYLETALVSIDRALEELPIYLLRHPEKINHTFIAFLPSARHVSESLIGREISPVPSQVIAESRSHGPTEQKPAVPSPMFPAPSFPASTALRPATASPFPAPTIFSPTIRTPSIFPQAPVSATPHAIARLAPVNEARRHIVREISLPIYLDFSNHDLFKALKQKQEIYDELVMKITSANFPTQYEAFILNLEKETWYEACRDNPMQSAHLATIAFLNKNISQEELLIIHRACEVFSEAGVTGSFKVLTSSNAEAYLKAANYPPFSYSPKGVAVYELRPRIQRFLSSLDRKSIVERTVVEYEKPLQGSIEEGIHEITSVKEGCKQRDAVAGKGTFVLLPPHLNIELFSMCVNEPRTPADCHYMLGYSSDDPSSFYLGKRPISIATPYLSREGFAVEIHKFPMPFGKVTALDYHDSAYHIPLEMTLPRQHLALYASLAQAMSEHKEEVLSHSSSQIQREHHEKIFDSFTGIVTDREVFASRKKFTNVLDASSNVFNIVDRVTSFILHKRLLEATPAEHQLKFLVDVHHPLSANPGDYRFRFNFTDSVVSIIAFTTLNRSVLQ